MQLFDEKETTAELDDLLRKAGHDPVNPEVLQIKSIISGYYARRTAEVLAKVRDVLDRMTETEH
ncbi:MAG TPA: hypothetical protein VIV09_12685 [Pseudolabrys sp.]|jgi:hypothetical protein